MNNIELEYLYLPHNALEVNGNRQSDSVVLVMLCMTGWKSGSVGRTGRSYGRTPWALWVRGVSTAGHSLSKPGQLRLQRRSLDPGAHREAPQA